MILTINPDNPQSRLIAKVVDALRKGAVICYPTDTVYGIGCDITQQKAIKRVFQLKRRPQEKPFSFMCADLKDVSLYGHVSNHAYRCMKKAAPGPFTFVLPGTKLVPRLMMTRQKTVGIRVPDNRICLELVQTLGNPIVTTSAVKQEEEPLVEAYQLEEALGRQVDIFIDGGPVYPNPSTVVSFVGDEPEILRLGKGDPQLIG